MLKNSASDNRAQEGEILRAGGLIEVLRRRLRPITGFGKRVDLPEWTSEVLNQVDMTKEDIHDRCYVKSLYGTWGTSPGDFGRHLALAPSFGRNRSSEGVCRRLDAFQAQVDLGLAAVMCGVGEVGP
jgi:hypothetical protein